MGNSSSHGRRGKSQRDGDGDHYGSSSGTHSSGPPSAPGKPYLIVPSPADEPDVITVKWKHPIHDGGSKIIGYTVEHRRTASPHWVRASPGKVRHNQLTLSGLEPGWRYQFRVMAANSSGCSLPSDVSDPVTITAHRTAIVAPVFISGIEDHVALENDQVKFEVEFEGTPVPKISWYKDGFELFSNRRQRVNTDNGVSTLYIHQAEYSDEGEIKCSATNRAGHAVTKARLRLEAPPMVRLPQDYEEGLLLEQNEPMRLKVSVSGRPLPQITWFHEGEEIRGGDRFEVIHTDKYAALKLSCAKRSDRGCYQIQAVNPLGEHTASFLVTITDRPSPPGKVHVSKTSGKSVTLSWKPSEDDGGCKIGSYIIEYNRVGWDMWLKASTSRKLTADLDDLLEGSEYRFRVKAENPYGISSPSDVSDPIFLPDIRRGIYKPENTASPLLLEDEEKLVENRLVEPTVLENVGRKSKSPEPSIKPRKLSVDEVSPPVPQRRKKKTKLNNNGLEEDVYKSLSFLDVSNEPSQQPIEQKDHWGLSAGWKANSGRISPKDLSNSPITLSDQKTKGNSTDSLTFNYERGIATPISLSSPELGTESEGFDEHIRNSYSSSELLYERNLSRFNEYSTNEENSSSSEAQKIAIYAMDRKNSLRRSPITRVSNDGSEDKSIFGDSESVQSVVEVKNKLDSSSVMSLSTCSADEEIDDDDDDAVPSTSFADLNSDVTPDSDEIQSLSEKSNGSPVKFGSGKRALEHNTSSAFFSTVYYDDDYSSDQRSTDGERSTSPVCRSEIHGDAISRDPLNSESSSSSDCRSDRIDVTEDKKHSGTDRHHSNGRNSSSKTDTAEIICAIDHVDDYRARDGIPKFVMLPNPFYRENAPTDRSGGVKFQLSTASNGIVPPEIPVRSERAAENHVAIPVITVTEMSGEHSPTSFLKKIVVPSFSEQNESYYNKYNNVNSSSFSTLKKFSDRDEAAGNRNVIRTRSSSPEVRTRGAEITVVKHYGDIAEAYSGASKKPTPKTYLDFEQLKMAAVDDELPVIGAGDCGSEEEKHKHELEVNRHHEEEEEEEEQQQNGYQTDFGDISMSGNDVETITSDDRTVGVETTLSSVPYLMIFGNLSLALFGYWLYACKDERASVPIFGFLLFRFFKTQVWDRIE